MPESTKPLISYLLLTYNQEKFVKEAVESALAQTYSPLEIIISDDHSADKTWEIIKELVNNYKGPHKIIINQNHYNLGIANHINKVMSMAKGELFVMGAGDDIAFPNKTERFTEIWYKNKSITALCSGYTLIDLDNNIIKNNFLKSFGLSSKDKYTEIKETYWSGCSVAFPAKLFKFFGNIKYKDSTEDRVMFRRAILLGQVFRIKEPLIYYRLGGISKTNTDIHKLYRLLTLHFYGLKNFFYDVKKVPQTSEIQNCKRYIYNRCWNVLPKLIILKILINFNINPFPTLAKIKEILRPYYHKLKDYIYK